MTGAIKLLSLVRMLIAYRCVEWYRDSCGSWPYRSNLPVVPLRTLETLVRIGLLRREYDAFRRAYTYRTTTYLPAVRWAKPGKINLNLEGIN